MIPAWIEGVGVIAGFLGVIAWFPQIMKVWSEGEHEGISDSHLHIGFYLTCAMACLWGTD